MKLGNKTLLEHNYFSTGIFFPKKNNFIVKRKLERWIDLTNYLYNRIEFEWSTYKESGIEDFASIKWTWNSICVESQSKRTSNLMKELMLYHLWIHIFIFHKLSRTNFFICDHCHYRHVFLVYVSSAKEYSLIFF